MGKNSFLEAKKKTIVWLKMVSHITDINERIKFSSSIHLFNLNALILQSAVQCQSGLLTTNKQFTLQYISKINYKIKKYKVQNIFTIKYIILCMHCTYYNFIYTPSITYENVIYFTSLSLVYFSFPRQHPNFSILHHVLHFRLSKDENLC